MATLKACPFCGHTKPELESTLRGWFVACHYGCKAITALFDTTEGAEAAWNARTASGAPEAPRYKWTVEFEVDAIWVADGFNLTDERALDMLATDLGYATSSELGARVIKAPDADRIKREQGYITEAAQNE